MKNLIFIFIFSLIGFRITAQTKDKELEKVAQYLAGSYSSQAQHLKDTANYFDIRLQIVPIWKDRTDGYWFYVEQAVADYIDKPYRQRIYHLTKQSKGTFVSEVYTFAEPLRFTHLPELAEKTLTPDSLTAREGCAVLLHETKDGYAGGTDEKKCPSDRKGATYATSEVTLLENELHSWDRGYDDKDVQVWGAEKGGYVFLKLSTF